MCRVKIIVLSIKSTEPSDDDDDYISNIVVIWKIFRNLKNNDCRTYLLSHRKNKYVINKTINQDRKKFTEKNEQQ